MVGVEVGDEAHTFFLEKKNQVKATGDSSGC
jgi:hypothetical protein